MLFQKLRKNRFKESWKLCLNLRSFKWFPCGSLATNLITLELTKNSFFLKIIFEKEAKLLSIQRSKATIFCEKLLKYTSGKTLSANIYLFKPQWKQLWNKVWNMFKVNNKNIFHLPTLNIFRAPYSNVLLLLSLNKWRNEIKNEWLQKKYASKQHQEEFEVRFDHL